MWRRPRLFGGSLEEYTDLTGEPIPLVVVSCIRILSQHALHHQGLFRISGSQLEINHMREAFESGDDPLRDANDANSIAGLLKLYLREPLFPFYLFDLLTNCAKCSITAADLSANRRRGGVDGDETKQFSRSYDQKTHQLKQQRQNQISAIDDLLGKLSSATTGGSGDDHQKQ